MLAYLSKLYKWLISNLSFIGALGIVFLMLIIMMDIFSRNIFNQPLVGIPEVVKVSIVCITFLQIPHVLEQGRHINSSVLVDLMSEKWKLIIGIFSNLLGLILFTLLFYSTVPYAWEAFVTSEYEGMFIRIPTFPIYFTILLGSLLMVIQYAIFIKNNINKIRHS